ncbi:phosphotransferase [Arthroderma uncinatum]|uniref:phosphotransferase n=1 Tax=Arthroderma uncinatum TaxID=74035 RepID=UPI00144AC300|nr:phosphotransferase [Arthroderma uncinatum]KAF3479945.1 phosphotransferase [Arthroderma uncinatum]
MRSVSPFSSTSPDDYEATSHFILRPKFLSDFHPALFAPIEKTIGNLFIHKHQNHLGSRARILLSQYFKAMDRVAAEAAGRPRCSQIIKLAEGGFNKIFLLTMDDETEVIARIPTPIAGPRHYTTASEAATMQCLRDSLHIPVPRILAYASTTDNPVGAEYIIMERLHGESLGSRWLSFSTAQTADLMTQIAKIEGKIFKFKFPAYGSLYHRRDIPAESRVDFPSEGGDFCVGPICKRQFWHGERADMQLDRGPFPSRSELSTPILRHPDLSYTNLLLTPGTNKIEAIIDWQDAAILPLFMQAGYPAFCEHDLSQVQSLEPPKRLDNYDAMSEVDKLKVDMRFRLEEANLYYYAATGVENALHMQALRQPGLGMIQYLISQAGYPWDADLINLKAGLVGLAKIWSEIIPHPCPVSFPPADKKAILHDASEWRECAEILSNIQNSLGVDREGGTHPDDFEHACEMARQLRVQIYSNAEEKERKLFWKSWIFKDDGDATPPPVL